jgi:hypothetical protein
MTSLWGLDTFRAGARVEVVPLALWLQCLMGIQRVAYLATRPILLAE